MRSKVGITTKVAAVVLCSLTLITGLLMLPTPATASSRQSSGPYYYLSLGDSLATGDYSTGIVTDLASDIPLTLENFGCGGATTATILTGIGCPYNGGATVDAVAYPSESQIAAAVAFIKAHPGQVKLITIDIGANDYAQCVVTLSPPSSCVQATVPGISANITDMASQLRQAAGPSTEIFGMTDLVDALSYWLNVPGGKPLAKDWISEFKNTLIPTLTTAYATAKIPLINIVADSGAYQPLTRLVKYPPYGKIPLAIARGCELILMCSSDNQNAHPTEEGYTLMAREVAAAYLKASTAKVSR